MAKSIEITLQAVKATKNCVLYVELDEDEEKREPKDKNAVISRGTFYLSKDAIKSAGFKKAPKQITLTIESA